MQSINKKRNFFLKLLTTTVATEFIPQYIDLMNTAVFLEYWSKVIFIHILRHLADKHFNVVWIWFLRTIIVEDTVK